MPGRFESIEAGQPFAVIVDYAHTPDSLVNVLRGGAWPWRRAADRRLRRRGRPRPREAPADGARRRRARRPRDRHHRQPAHARIRPRSPNEVGRRPRLEIVLDRRAAIEPALADAQPGDVVVIAGKGADTEMELADRSMPFDDRAVAREVLRGDVIPLELKLIEPLGQLIARPWADVVTGMQVDSRRIEEGDLFVAIGGGEDFVEHALARGASAALVPDDAFAALAAIAGAVRDRSQARVVGITGSTGKTSTKDILFALCAPHRRTIANEGNYNTEIGVPLTLCRIERGHRALHQRARDARPGQIAWLASFVRPDVAVITNIGPAHLSSWARSRTSRAPRPS